MYKVTINPKGHLIPGTDILEYDVCQQEIAVVDTARRLQLSTRGLYCCCAFMLHTPGKVMHTHADLSVNAGQIADTLRAHFDLSQSLNVTIYKSARADYAEQVSSYTPLIEALELASFNGKAFTYKVTVPGASFGITPDGDLLCSGGEPSETVFVNGTIIRPSRSVSAQQPAVITAGIHRL